MATIMENDPRDSTPPLDEPSARLAVSEDDKLAQARALIQQAIALVGESDFTTLVETAGQERLRNAVARLMSEQWWQQTLKVAMTNPGKYNTQLLCKLLDKAVPTQQAAKQGVDEGFKLVIETVVVEPPANLPQAREENGAPT